MIGLCVTIDIQLTHHPSPFDGDFQVAVRTVLLFHLIFRGRLTLSKSSWAIDYILHGD
jgi:hypothetical protein